MSLRTYPLIVHPEFLEYVSGTQSALALPFYGGSGEAPVGVPEIPSIFALAGYLQIAPGNIAWMIKKKEEHYNTFPIRKRSGKQRFISSPRTFLKVIQWWILDTILSKPSLSGSVHGFVKGKSFLTNAQVHLGAKHLLNVDIKDFFPSVRRESVDQVFRDFGYCDKVSGHLAELCTLYDALPQGAPTSPTLSNLIFKSLDYDLEKLAEEAGLIYTRYADDLTFSSKDKRIPKDIVGQIGKIVQRERLSLNEEKTRWMGPNDRKEITGLRLGQNGVGFKRSKLNAARGWFYTIADSPQDHLQQLDRVRGTVALLDYVRGPGSEKVIELGRIAKDRLVMCNMQNRLTLDP